MRIFFEFRTYAAPAIRAEENSRQQRASPQVLARHEAVPFEPATINLMDALKKSLARGRSAAPSEDGRRHRGKSKESGRKRPSTKRQRRAS